MSDPVIDRIRKMLALADDPSAPAGEREAALAAAARVMARHRIDEDQVRAAGDGPQVTGDVVAVDVGEFLRHEYWALDLLTVIGQVVTVDAVFIEDHRTHARSTTLIGRSTAIEYVRLLYGWLRPQIEADARVIVDAERGYRDLMGRPPTAAEIDRYREGFYVGAIATVGGRLEDLHRRAEGAAGTALVVSDRAALTRYYGPDAPRQVDTIAQRDLSGEAMVSGAAAGERVDLNPANKVGRAQRPELDAGRDA